MPSNRAVSSARRRSREAIAAISQNLPFCIPGMTFFTPILAVLRIPQRTLLAISGHDSRKLAFTKTGSPLKTLGSHLSLQRACVSEVEGIWHAADGTWAATIGRTRDPSGLKSLRMTPQGVLS